MLAMASVALTGFLSFLDLIWTLLHAVIRCAAKSWSIFYQALSWAKHAYRYGFVAGTLMWTMSRCSLWGLPQLIDPHHTCNLTASNTTFRCIGYARRVGRKRIRAATSRRASLRTSSGSSRPECGGESHIFPPIWTPEEIVSWSSTNLVLEAHADVICGALRNPAGLPQQPPPVKIKGCFRNQIWTIEVPHGTLWREVQWQFVRKLSLGSHNLIISHAGHQVSLDAAIPAGDIHGQVQVDLRLLEQPDGLRARSRQRSRSRRPDRPPQISRGVQSELRVIDMEAMHIRLRVPGGEWTLRATLEQLGAQSWFAVTTSMLDQQLRAMYPDLLAPMGRLAFAVEGRVLMPHAVIAHNMRGLGEQIQMIAMPPLGSARRPEYADGLSSDSSMADSEGEQELQLPHLYVLMHTSGPLVAHRVLLPRGTITLGGLEQLLLTQHPDLRRHGRVILHSLGGRYLPPTTLVTPAEHQGFLGFPDPGFGAAPTPDQYNHGLAIAKRVISDQHRHAQLRLLLRGEPGLAQRLAKHEQDPARCKQILLDLCKRYGMTVQVSAGAHTASSPPRPASTSEFKPTHKQTPKVAKAPKTTHELLAQDWSVPLADDIAFNTEGIYFPSTQQEAESLVRRLGHPELAVGVLSIKAINTARLSQPLTFRTISTDATGRVRERLLTGYLNQVGTVDVTYKVLAISIPRLPESSVSVKLTLRTTAKYLSEAQWQTVRQLKDRKAVQAYLDEKHLQLIDLWDLRCQDGDWMAHIRIKRGQLESWLGADIPFGIALPPDLSELHRVVWDQDLPSLAAARKRYLDTPGFSGLVLSKTGIGIRIETCHHAAALQHLGKPAGELFELRGVPVEATADTIREVIAHVGWEATLIESFRRVHQGQAIFRLRAPSPPSCEIIKTCMAQEIVQLQIAKVHQRRAPPPPSPRQSQIPQTWGDAARHALGVQKKFVSSSAPEPVAAPPSRVQSDSQMEEDDDDDETASPESAPDHLPSESGRSWARRLQEPSPKIRRTTQGDPPHDPRVDTLMQQMAQVMGMLQTLTAQAGATL